MAKAKSFWDDPLSGVGNAFSGVTNALSGAFGGAPAPAPAAPAGPRFPATIARHARADARNAAPFAPNPNDAFAWQQGNFNNQLGAFNANQNAAQNWAGVNQGWDRLNQGWQGLSNDFSLGQGNLALGNLRANQDYDLGQGNLALGNKRADQGYDIDLRGLGLQDKGLNLQGRGLDQSYDINSRARDLAERQEAQATAFGVYDRERDDARYANRVGWLEQLWGGLLGPGASGLANAIGFTGLSPDGTPNGLSVAQNTAGSNISPSMLPGIDEASQNIASGGTKGTIPGVPLTADLADQQGDAAWMHGSIGGNEFNRGATKAAKLLKLKELAKRSEQQLAGQRTGAGINQLGTQQFGFNVGQLPRLMGLA